MKIQDYTPSGFRNWSEYYRSRQRRTAIKETLATAIGIAVIILCYAVAGYVEWHL